MANFSFDVLSKQHREKEVEVLVEERNERSPVVRLTFREIPDTEFEILHAAFIGAVAAVGRLSREITASENKVHQERASTGHASPETIEAQKKLIKGVQEAKADLLAARKDLVRKCVIDHRAEDFTMDHLPFPNDPLADQVRAALRLKGFDDTAIEGALKVGYLQIPFKGATWSYGEGGEAKELPGTSEETLEFYRRLKPETELLNSICNAVIYWHRLALPSAELQKKALADERLARNKQFGKIEVLRKMHLVKESRVPELLVLDSGPFELLVELLVECLQLHAKKGEAKETPENPSKG